MIGGEDLHGIAFLSTVMLVIRKPPAPGEILGRAPIVQIAGLIAI
jgi:hypothetical protein